MNRYFALAIMFTLLNLSACTQNVVPAATPTVTLEPGTGRVTGILQYRSGGSGQPSRDSILYLAPTLKDSNGIESIVALDRFNSPRTSTDNDGRFVFSNIPPGNYGLVLDLVTAQYLLNKPDSEDGMIITVSADIQSDIGVLLYDELPGSPPPTAPYPYP